MVYLTDREEYPFQDNRYCSELERRDGNESAADDRLGVAETEG